MFRKSDFTTALAAILITSTYSPVAAGTTLKSVQTLKLQKASIAPKTARVPGLSFSIARDMKSKLTTMQWTMKASKNGRPILSGNQYRLYNSVAQAGLTRKVRSLAANLGWLSSKSNAFNVRIRRLNGNGQVRYGDVVALEVKSYGWLKYKKQSHGINLSDDNNKPHYIWKVTGGQKGTKLVAGMPFALHNTRMGTEMTYCERTWGIDLGWHGKSKCGSGFSKLSGKVFGKNGLFASDGLTGKGARLLKDHICETAVSAIGGGIGGATGGSTGVVLAAAIPLAIQECKKL
ncbi:hypothetical protein RXV86_09925 [Alisedimentitalea sp. MJ-SS2]|uniref:hypothetical protein n=1 Tax=Aliisedimentitalea sp. MJ-SS2 TaxID=3049795 RepID=UPI00290C26A7|nr:hypothetical protein [Alisedimentitalea sp. MJ-SS2]MDU8927700.1 hypothetical protein [Alisedimentitalea sp. MJ-SS2]